jgi:hypothetical protein
MHDDTRFTGTGACQNQYVFIFAVGNKSHLLGIVQIADNALKRLPAGGPLQNLLTVSKIAFHNFGFVLNLALLT